MSQSIGDLKDFGKVSKIASERKVIGGFLSGADQPLL
jgi:hypothetical protein